MQTLAERYNAAADRLAKGHCQNFYGMDENGQAASPENAAKVCLASALALAGLGTIDNYAAVVNDDVVDFIITTAHALGLVVPTPGYTHIPTQWICGINNNNTQDQLVGLLRKAAERAPATVH